MSKKSLATRLSKKTGKSVADSLELVELLFQAIKEDITETDRLVIRDFGSFYTSLQKERLGRNPKSGEKLIIKEKLKVKFKANPNFLTTKI